MSTYNKETYLKHKQYRQDYYKKYYQDNKDKYKSYTGKIDLLKKIEDVMEKVAPELFDSKYRFVYISHIEETLHKKKGGEIVKEIAKLQKTTTKLKESKK